MCYSPLHLPNKSRQFDIDKDRMFLDVPCGHCGECRQKRQDDATSRLYYEFVDTAETFVPGFHYTSPDGKVNIHEHGYTYFETFTYNEEMCPWLHGIKCFRPDDYRYFMMNLRADLRRLGYYDNYDPTDDSQEQPLKVYWVSEYGGDTYRPHYHALFFIRFAITPEEFEKLLQRNWCIVSRYNSKGSDRISLGWTDIENPYSSKHQFPHELVCDSLSVLGYVAQYVGKDIEFEYVLEQQKNSMYDGLPITKEDYKFLRPFTRQSNGIGECMKDRISMDDLLDGRIVIPDRLKVTKVVDLPLYVDRKVFYDYNPEDKCFRLNQKGYDMKKHRLEYNRGYVKQQIDWIWSHICQLWTDNSSDFIGDLMRNHGLVDTPAAAMMKVSDTLYNRYDDFIDYIVYYKDIHSSYCDYITPDTDLKDFATNFIVKHSAPDPCTTNLFDVQYCRDVYPQDYRIMIKQSYGTCCDRFRGFDDVLAIINGLNLAFSIGRQKLYLQRRREKARQKKLYKQTHLIA